MVKTVPLCLESFHFAVEWLKPFHFAVEWLKPFHFAVEWLKPFLLAVQCLKPFHFAETVSLLPVTLCCAMFGTVPLRFGTVSLCC